MNLKQLPNWLLALVLTVFWRVDRVRDNLFPEVERRHPKVYLKTWRGQVLVLAK